MFWLFLLQWRHLAEIFIFIKMISHISFIILVNQIVFLSPLIPTKLTITKIHHLISSRFERSEHKKSQCAPIMYIITKKDVKIISTLYRVIFQQNIFLSLTVWIHMFLVVAFQPAHSAQGSYYQTKLCIFLRYLQLILRSIS